MDLLVKAQSGDGDALDQLLVRYVPRLKRWAKGRLPWGLRTMLDTGDLVQDAVVNAIPHLATFDIRADRALEFYLRQMVRNRIIDLKRRARRRPVRQEFPEEVAVVATSPLDAVIAAERLDLYKRGIAMLPTRDRQAIRLRLEEGLAFAEIATRLGMGSADAARMAVGRSIVRLAVKMDALSAMNSVKNRN